MESSRNTKLKVLKGFYRHDVIQLLPKNRSDFIGVELGVAEGVFSKRMVESGVFKDFIGIDMYQDHHDVKEYIKALRDIGIFSKYKLLRMTFDQAYDLFPDQCLDFLYIDGYAHTGEEGGETIYKWYDKVKVGGVIAGDDYHERWPLVVQAVNSFIDQADLALNVTELTEEGTYCRYPSWAVVKTHHKRLVAPTVKQAEKFRGAQNGITKDSTILFLEFSLSDTRSGAEADIRSRIDDAGFTMAKLRLDENDPVRNIEQWIYENKNKPAAILRWDEHGGLFGSLKRFRNIATWCYENNVAPLTIDFAYFDHYNGYMVDLLEKDGSPSIRREFVEMKDNFIELEQIEGETGEYIKRIQEIYKKHKNSKSMAHVREDYKYVAFTQSLINGCRLMDSNCPIEWMERLYTALGDDVIFKTQPAPFVKADQDLSKFKIVLHRNATLENQVANYGLELNSSLMAQAECCIINSSGVSSEFVINEIPVIATGRSWFNGLNIFHEPSDWDKLKSMVQSKEYRIGPTQKIMRKKWITWWIRHQFVKNERTTIIEDCITAFNERV